MRMMTREVIPIKIFSSAAVFLSFPSEYSFSFCEGTADLK